VLKRRVFKQPRRGRFVLVPVVGRLAASTLGPVLGSVRHGASSVAFTVVHVGSTPCVNSTADSKFALCVNSIRHPARFKFEPLNVFQTRHPPALKLQWLAGLATRQNLSLGGWLV
jgi:uncharacterized protein (DUF1684 family)